jgi:hypothetical protein
MSLEGSCRSSGDGDFVACGVIARGNRRRGCTQSCERSVVSLRFAKERGWRDPNVITAGRLYRDAHA